MYTKKQIAARIKTIAGNSKKLRDQIQDVLVNIAGHAYEHGDVTQYDQLMAATSGMNRKKIAAWIREHGFASLNDKGEYGVNKSARKAADHENGAACTEYLAANAPAWYADEETMPQIKQALDVAARVKSLASQIDSARENGRQVKIDYREAHAAIEALKGAIANTADSVEAGKADEVLAEPAH